MRTAFFDRHLGEWWRGVIVNARATAVCAVTTAREEANRETAAAPSAAAAEYTGKEISAGDFARQLVECMTEDVVFRSTDTPTWETAATAVCQFPGRGGHEILARYDYENDHEVIHGGIGHAARPGAERTRRPPQPLESAHRASCQRRLLAASGALSQNAGGRAHGHTARPPPEPGHGPAPAFASAVGQKRAIPSTLTSRTLRRTCRTSALSRWAARWRHGWFWYASIRRTDQTNSLPTASSQRWPSGSATYPLMPPHSRRVTGATSSAPAATAASKIPTSSASD